MATGWLSLGGTRGQEQQPVVEVGADLAAELGEGREQAPGREAGRGWAPREGGQPQRGDDILQCGLLVDRPARRVGVTQLGEEHLRRGRGGRR